MKCIDSRPSPDGRRRKYRHPGGLITETIEVPLVVWRHVNTQGRGSNRIEAFRRTIERRRMKHCAVELVRAGWKPLAVAHEIGIPVRTVQRWAKEGRSACCT